MTSRSIRAIADARAAGIAIALCTGRNWRESRHVAAAVGQVEPVAVAGGAVVACGQRGATLHRFPMEPTLVKGLVRVLVSHGHAALVLKDGHQTDLDYVVVSPRGEEAVAPITRWWFQELGVPVRYITNFAEDPHPEHTIRVGVCGTLAETRAAAGEVVEEFGERINFHHFPAVVPGARPSDPEATIVILEIFDRRVSKWAAIEWMASRAGIHDARIAAIGNDVNDVAMLRGAGLSVAMGNAVPEALAVAHRRTLDNASDGVAYAIDRILAGEW